MSYSNPRAVNVGETKRMLKACSCMKSKSGKSVCVRCAGPEFLFNIVAVCLSPTLIATGVLCRSVQCFSSNLCSPRAISSIVGYDV